MLGINRNLQYRDSLVHLYALERPILIETGSIFPLYDLHICLVGLDQTGDGERPKGIFNRI